MKRILTELKTRQITLIPSCAILKMTWKYGDKFKYRLAFGWLWFYASIGFIKRKYEDTP